SMLFNSNIFRILSISTTYSTPVTPPGFTNSQVWADAGGWDSNDNSPTYNSVIGPTNPNYIQTGKAGGTITSTYTVLVVGAGTQNISGYIMDHSGGSFHYNSDFMTTVIAIVSKFQTSLLTNASPASATLGSLPATLSDSAVLSGGFFETGTITFTLTGPGGFHYTQTDTVSGNGTYTAGTTLPTSGTVAGKIGRASRREGRENTLRADEQGRTEEQRVVRAAQLSLVTSGSGGLAWGCSAPVLSSEVVLSGGFFETGTITFTLTGPGGFHYTQTDTVSGNGTYTAGTTLPTSGTVAG